MKRILLIGLLALGVAACVQTESENVRTNGIWAGMDVAAESDSTLDVKVELRSGSEFSNTNIELTGGDYLEASIAGVTRRLSEDREIYGRVRYETSFSGLSATGGESLRISLQRDDGADAHTPVTLPTSFALGSPATGSSFDISNNDQISVSWNPADAATTVTFHASCSDGAENYSTSVELDVQSGTGNVDLNTSALVSRMGPILFPSQLSCEVDIIAERSASGDVSDEYADGEWAARQTRSLQVFLVP